MDEERTLKLYQFYADFGYKMIRQPKLTLYMIKMLQVMTRVIKISK